MDAGSGDMGGAMFFELDPKDFPCPAEVNVVTAVRVSCEAEVEEPAEVGGGAGAGVRGHSWRETPRLGVK